MIPPATPDDRLTDVDGLDLARVVAALRRGWLIVLGCAVAAVLFEAVQLHGAPPIYSVEVEVAAVQAPVAEVAETDQQGRLGADGEGSHGSRPSVITPLYFTLYLESLRTRDVADAVARTAQIAMDPPSPAGQPVSGARVQRYLLSQLSVNQDQRKHTFATLRLRSPRPEAAEHLLLALHLAADDHIRRMALARSRQTIAGLSAAAGAVANPAASQLLAEQQRIEATATTSAPFAAQIIGGPAVDPKPLNRPIKSLVSALVVGAAIGAAIALALEQLLFTRRRDRGAEVK